MEENIFFSVILSRPREISILTINLSARGLFRAREDLNFRGRFFFMSINKKQIINGAIVFALILLAGGSLMAVKAANVETASNDSFIGRKFANLTAEQQAELQTQRAEQEKLREAQQALIQSALDSGDYQAWLKAVGTANPLAQKITADNFAKFVEAHKLRQQADQIMSELGLEGQGFGQMGLDQGNGWGRHGGMMGPQK